ncbi:MAG: hypothetical protein JSW39_06935 [Desulfobacterales bacterium]|nr:MAG: hypothetical protein JSW39_06935 [Desulfobacterales bacterium]
MENDRIKDLLKQIVHITDEDWETFKAGSPGVYKFFTRIEEIAKQRIVAEVIESRYCAAGLEKGQQIVIEGGALVPAKSTAPLCMRAIGPLTGFVNTILEMIVAGEDPNDRVFGVAECLDPGLEAGGLGKVKFKVRVEPI